MAVALPIFPTRPAAHRSPRAARPLRAARTVLASSFGALALRLDGRVRHREPMEVRKEDQELVGELAEEVKRLLGTGSLELIKADLQPALMTRLWLYKSPELIIRLHLYEDPSDTYIHNHSANFFSYCLAGSYAVWLH